MATIGPVSEGDRIIELDVLRGVALFGVLVMNFVGFAGAYVVATKGQLQALPTAQVDEWAHFAVLWLIGDKANTMFATLFGLGFYLQMKRGEGRPGFEARYRTRGDLEISVFRQTRSGTAVTMRTGICDYATVSMSLDDLAKVKALLQEAKTRLDETK